MVWLRDSTVAERFATCAMSAVFCSIRLRTNSSVILIGIQTTFFPDFMLIFYRKIKEKAN